MKQDWTKEPIKIRRHPDLKGDYLIFPSPKDSSEDFNTGRRLERCYNACAGLSNEDLKLVKEVKAMRDVIHGFVNTLKSEGFFPEEYEHGENLLNRIEKGE